MANVRSCGDPPDSSEDGNGSAVPVGNFSRFGRQIQPSLRVRDAMADENVGSSSQPVVRPPRKKAGAIPLGKKASSSQQPCASASNSNFNRNLETGRTVNVSFRESDKRVTEVLIQSADGTTIDVTGQQSASRPPAQSTSHRTTANAPAASKSAAARPQRAKRRQFDGRTPCYKNTRQTSDQFGSPRSAAESSSDPFAFVATPHKRMTTQPPIPASELHDEWNSAGIDLFPYGRTHSKTPERMLHNSSPTLERPSPARCAQFGSGDFDGEAAANDSDVATDDSDVFLSDDQLQSAHDSEVENSDPEMDEPWPRRPPKRKAEAVLGQELSDKIKRGIDNQTAFLRSKYPPKFQTRNDAPTFISGFRVKDANGLETDWTREPPPAPAAVPTCENGPLPRLSEEARHLLGEKKGAVFFHTILTPEIVANVLKHTNNYAQSYFEAKLAKHRANPEVETAPKRWRKLEEAEFYAFVGSCYLQGIYHLNQQSLRTIYGSDGSQVVLPLQLCFSRDRLMAIFKFLRFHDRTGTCPPASSVQAPSASAPVDTTPPHSPNVSDGDFDADHVEGQDNWEEDFEDAPAVDAAVDDPGACSIPRDYKIKEFMDPVVANMVKLVEPGNIIVVDEALVSFRGGVGWRVYLKEKPGRYGIKEYLACDGVTGIILAVEPYLGRSSKTINRGLHTSIVLRLVEKFAGQHITVVGDRAYTSPTLVDQLLAKGFHYVGTCCGNRLQLPSEFCNTPLDACGIPPVEEDVNAAGEPLSKREEAARKKRAADFKKKTDKCGPIDEFGNRLSKEEVLQRIAALEATGVIVRKQKKTAAEKKQEAEKKKKEAEMRREAEDGDGSAAQKKPSQSTRHQPMASRLVNLGERGLHATPAQPSQARPNGSETDVSTWPKSGFLFSGDITVTRYEKRPKKSVILLSTIHRRPLVAVSAKAKPEIIEFYNRFKPGVDVVDQLTANFTTKRICRRWPVRIFFFLLDLVGIQSYLLYQLANPLGDFDPHHRFTFLQKLACDLMQEHRRTRRKVKTAQSAALHRIAFQLRRLARMRQRKMPFDSSLSDSALKELGRPGNRSAKKSRRQLDFDSINTTSGSLDSFSTSPSTSGFTSTASTQSSQHSGSSQSAHLSQSSRPSENSRSASSGGSGSSAQRPRRPQRPKRPELRRTCYVPKCRARSTFKCKHCARICCHVHAIERIPKGRGNPGVYECVFCEKERRPIQEAAVYIH